MEEKRHYAVIDPYTRKLSISYKNEVIAQSEKALIVKEVGKGVYDPVFYIPKEDVKITLAPETDRKSHCPIKGDASYWNVEGDFTENYFAWSYEDPLPRAKKLQGYIAFNIDYISFLSEVL